MPVSVYIATSLDGFIADRDGGLGWLNAFPNPDASDYGFAAFLARVDALVMGRATFDAVRALGPWPYALPVVVLSRSLAALPPALRGRAELAAGAPPELVDRLRARGFRRLYVDGGHTVQRFLAADLVDEIILSTLPVLLGRGVPLFGETDRVLRFRHTKTETFQSGIVQSHYSRDR